MWFLLKLSKGPWGPGNICWNRPLFHLTTPALSKEEDKQRRSAVAGDALWLMIQLIVCQSAPNKLSCPQLCIPGCPMVFCSWMKNLIVWGGMKVGSESNRKQFAGLIILTNNSEAAAFFICKHFNLMVQSFFFTLKTAVEAVLHRGSFSSFRWYNMVFITVPVLLVNLIKTVTERCLVKCSLCKTSNLWFLMCRH